MMKKLSLSIIFACCTLAMAAQDEAIRVNYQGARPTIKDFVEAYLADLTNPTDEDDCDGEALSLYKNLMHAIECKDKGQPLQENATLTIDLKNGFLLYEQKYEDWRKPR